MAAEKTYKFPKSFGACADRLWDLQQERRAAQKVADAIEAEERALKNHVIEGLPKGDGGAVGKHHRVTVYTVQKPVVKDWDKFFAWVAKTKSFDMLQHRISEEAVDLRLEKKVKVPGLETFGVVKVSLEKVGR